MGNWVAFASKEKEVLPHTKHEVFERPAKVEIDRQSEEYVRYKDYVMHTSHQLFLLVNALAKGSLGVELKEPSYEFNIHGNSLFYSGGETAGYQGDGREDNTIAFVDSKLFEIWKLEGQNGHANTGGVRVAAIIGHELGHELIQRALTDNITSPILVGRNKAKMHESLAEFIGSYVTYIASYGSGSESIGTALSVLSKVRAMADKNVDALKSYVSEAESPSKDGVTIDKLNKFMRLVDASSLAWDVADRTYSMPQLAMAQALVESGLSFPEFMGMLLRDPESFPKIKSMLHDDSLEKAYQDDFIYRTKPLEVIPPVSNEKDLSRIAKLLPRMPSYIRELVYALAESKGAPLPDQVRREIITSSTDYRLTIKRVEDAVERNRGISAAAGELINNYRKLPGASV